MKFPFVLLFIAIFAASVSAQRCRGTTITGSGATFPEPIYRLWIRLLRNNPRVTYNAVGSSAGIADFTDGDTDFGGTDRPLTAADLRRLNAVQCPTVGGGVAIAYRNGRCRNLKLTQREACDIFLGRKKWSDFDCRCRTDDITVVVRSDGSGTTNVFTQSLSAFCSDFRMQIGSGNTVPWPSDFVTADGNSGVAAVLRRNPCAIGYVGFGTARAQRLRVARIENRAGNCITPSSSSISAGLAGVTLDPVTLSGSDPNPPGPRSYPIVSYTYVIARRTGNGSRAACIRKTLNFFLSRNAQRRTARLGFAPLPRGAAAAAGAAVRLIRP